MKSKNPSSSSEDGRGLFVKNPKNAGVISNGSKVNVTRFENSVPYEQVNDLALAILYNSQSLFYIAQNGKFQSFSPHLIKFTGMSREQLINIGPLDIVHPEDRSSTRENTIKMLKGEKLNPYEFRIIDKDQNIKYIKETVASIKYAGDKATLGNWIDLTEYRQVESDLKVSEENYRNFFNNLNDAALLADADTGIIIEANPRASVLFGWNHNELVGMHQSQLHPKEQTKKFRELFRTHAAQKISFNEDGVISNRNGGVIPVTISSSVSEMHGKHYMLGIFHDISDRKRSEIALRESEEKFSKAFRANPSCISITTQKDGIFLDINESFTRLLGYTRDDVIGHSSKELQLWVKPEERDRILQKLRRSGKVLDEEYSTRTKSGEILLMLFSAEPIVISGELCIIAVTTDITDRQRTEQALKESEEKYRNVVERANDGVCIIQDKVLQYVNLQLAKIWGGDYREMIGSEFADYIFPESLPAVMENYTRRLSGEQLPSNYESVFRRKNGERAFVELNVGIINYLEKPAELVFIRDITEQKKTQQALKESEEKFSKAFRSNPSAISITTWKGGKFLEVNEGFTRDFGYTREEAVGHHSNEFNTWVNQEELKNILHKLRRNGRVADEEFTARTKSGEVRTMLFSAENIEIAGEPCILAMTFDISLRKKIEQALKDSEEMFSTVFQTSPGCIALVKVGDNVFVDVNDAFVKLNGYSREEVIGHTATEINIWEIAEERDRILKIMMENGRVRNEECHLRAKSGETHIGLFSAEVVNIHGEPYSIAVTTDITEQRHVEQALKESGEMFSTVFQTSPGCISVVKLGGGVSGERDVFVDVNDSFAKLHGYLREEIIGHTATELNLWEDREEGARILEKLHKAGAIHNEEFHIRTKSGETKIGLFSAQTVNIQAQPYIISVTTDVTEQRYFERALKESEEKFSAAFRSSPEILSVANLKTGKYIEVNDSFIKTTGYSREELVGHSVNEINMFVEAIDAERMVRAVQEQGGIKNMEFSFRMKSGEIRRWLCSSETTYIGGMPCSIAVATDITERKAMENELLKHKEHLEELVSLRTEELKSSNTKLEQDLIERRRIEEELRDAIKRADAANKAKSEFLARMSHEIRTPIHGVMGTLDLLRDTKLEPEQQQYINMSKNSAENLLNVINEILDFSKIEAGKLELEHKEFDLIEVLEDALEAVAVSAHRKGLEIILQLSQGVPALLTGDAAHLRQIIINLTGNAIKFTSQGEIVLRVETESITGNDIELHFSVKDTGIGIPKEKKEILFQPFEQVDGSNQRKYGGTGLGLSISKQLAELMGGRIWFKSWLGEGSVFHFTAQFTKQENPGKKDVLPEIPERLRGTPVLIVDDNTTNRSVLKDTLTGLGFRVTDISSGRSAVKEIEDAIGTSRHYQTVFLDKTMPELNGFETAGQILQSKYESKGIIMMLPSDNISNDFSKCQEMGISHFIVKPVKRSELIGTILKVLGAEKTGTVKEKTAPLDAITLIAQRAILVAEDNPTSQLIAKKMLEKAGHIVQLAGSGTEVIRMLKEGKYDLILMDVEMPEMSGIEATRLIRKAEQSTKQHMPIVAMTAYAMKEDRQRCLDAGMDTYISKPVNIEELQKIIAGFPATNKSLPPVVEIDTALKFVGGYKEILQEVVHVFLDDDYPEQLQKLKDGIATQNAETVKTAAHSIKGAVRSLGGKIPGDIALKLEEMGRNNQLEGAEAALQQLEQEIVRFAQFYSKYDWGK